MSQNRLDVEVAVIPAAGKGTRMRPATNVVPKALLTVVDRPSIQWVVEEAAAAGAREIILILDPGVGQLVERHFFELGHIEGLEHVTVRSVVQEEAKGLGHAVLMAADAVGERPFFCLLADDLILPGSPVLPGLARAGRSGVSALCLRELPDELLASKGVVVPGSDIVDRELDVSGAVEKPGVDAAPSRLGIQGRYLFTPEVFDLLTKTGPGYGGEIQLTDAIDELGRLGRCRGYVSNTTLLDVGNPIAYLHATTVLAASAQDYGDRFKAAVKDLAKEW
jgi:UTP--glucose-1-phosphate uridylyltransferase